MKDILIGFTVGLVCAFMIVISGCSTYSKTPIFPASQYTPLKKEHGLVLTEVGMPKWVSGKSQRWLETCDYYIDRKEGEPYVIFPDYVFEHCAQYGPVHTH
jgi:hypothetical protein